MSQREDNIQEAREALASIVEDLADADFLREVEWQGLEGDFEGMRRFHEIMRRHGFDRESFEMDPNEVIDQIRGPLSVDIKETVSVVWATGGPHFEMSFPLDDPDGVTFVSKPWFDRVELPGKGLEDEAHRWAEYVRETRLAGGW